MDLPQTRRAAHYDKKFFDEFAESSHRSATIILKSLFDVYRPDSVIDVGCGVGCWLKAASDLGVPQVRGFDGPWVDDTQLLFSPRDFTRIDFESSSWPRFGSADLAMSMEVAEHLSEAQGVRLIEELCRSASVVLFSAAIPAQGGEGHQNEKWQSWWAGHFAAFGYQPSLLLRDSIWCNQDVNLWYRQNTVVYFDFQRTPQLTALTPTTQPLDVVHPELYAIRVLKRLKHGRWRRALDGLRLR